MSFLKDLFTHFKRNNLLLISRTHTHNVLEHAQQTIKQSITKHTQKTERK